MVVGGGGLCAWESAASLVVAGARPMPAFTQDLAAHLKAPPRHSRGHEDERPWMCRRRRGEAPLYAGLSSDDKTD